MPRRKSKKTSKRLIFKNSPSAVGTQYIKQGHLNKVLRGSGFLTNAIKKIKKVGKKAIKSNLTKKLLMAGKKQQKASIRPCVALLGRKQYQNAERVKMSDDTFAMFRK